MVLKTTVSILLFGILLACSGGETSSAQPEMDAKSLFATKCTLCHGSDGKLQLAGASDLSKSELSLEEAIAVISNGRNTMAPYKDILSAEEIKSLAEYLETFRTH